MRLFLLPISTKRSLLYCQRTNKQLKIEQSYAAQITSKVSKKRIHKQLPDKPSWIDRLTSKASKTWLSWEKADKGWRKKVTFYGEKLFQRIPYEEWALKSIPPLSASRKTQKLGQVQKTLIVYPQSIITHASAHKMLRSFAAEERQGFHMKRMLASFLGMPIVAPIALIPVIPNLPFFYLCFRAWSHWRARSGSKHLNFLLEKKLVQPSHSKVLDEIYTLQKLVRSLETLKSEFRTIQSPPKNKIISSKSIKTRSQITPSDSAESSGETMLLSPSSGLLIAECLELPEIEQEVERAIRQVEASLRAERKAVRTIQRARLSAATTKSISSKTTKTE